MKVLAILTLQPDASLEVIRPKLADEIRGSWALYASGVLREVYATDLPKRVVFILEADNASMAERLLAQLPLVAAGAFHTEIVELRPFVNWSTLFSAESRH